MVIEVSPAMKKSKTKQPGGEKEEKEEKEEMKNDEKKKCSFKWHHIQNNSNCSISIVFPNKV